MRAAPSAAQSAAPAAAGADGADVLPAQSRMSAAGAGSSRADSAELQRASAAEALLQEDQALVHRLWAKYALEQVRMVHAQMGQTQDRVVFSVGSKLSRKAGTPADIFMKRVSSLVDPEVSLGHSSVTHASGSSQQATGDSDNLEASFTMQEEQGMSRLQPSAVPADAPTHVTFFLILNAHPHRHKLPPGLSAGVSQQSLSVLQLHVLEVIHDSKTSTPKTLRTHTTPIHRPPLFTCASVNFS